MASKKRKGKKKRSGLPRSLAINGPALGPAAAARKFQIRDDQRAIPVTLRNESDDGTTITIGDSEEVEPTLIIPTVALRSIAQVARVEELELQMPEDIERRLASNGKHFIRGMRRVFNPDDTDFVRAHVMTQLRDQRAGVPYELYLDFPTRYIGMLLDASVKTDRQRDDSAVPKQRWAVVKPTWTGSYSFDKVWRTSQAIAEKFADKQRRSSHIHPSAVLAMSALSLMKDAHLVRVDPEQVQVLPEWEQLGHLWDYAQDVQLPFERIYLDFEGPGGFAPVHHVEQGIVGADFSADLDIELRGALVWRDLSGRLVVNVIAWPRMWADKMHKAMQMRDTWSEYESVGQVIFGDGTVYEAVLEQVGTMTMRLGDSEVTAKPMGIPTAAITQEKLPGFVQIPLDRENVERVTDSMGGVSLGRIDGPVTHAEAQQYFVAGWAAVVLSSAARALAALSILEADEVELVDAPVEKRERDRAFKRGWKIAQVVFIRPPKKYLQANPPSGEEARYSHRFWVRAHTKHHPLGTRIADSRPDLCKPCHRCGTCRRVPTKAYIKGPPDKPLVPKSLAVRREKPREVTLPHPVEEPIAYMPGGAV